jgi:putative aldouronate transport system substrate-binding protein
LYFYEDVQGVIHFAPGEEAFREGLAYCALLYKEKLLSEVSFSYHKKQLMELVNDPEDLVGAFVSQSMKDVIYASSADVIARYVAVPPLEGPDGITNAVLMDYEPKIGGWIPANSGEPEKAYEIMETMLSDEASLISEYGEETVDWEFSGSGDISTYSEMAKVTTLNYLKDQVQNKNFAGAGPQVVPGSYIDGVSWNGDNSLVEYIDARAVKRYERSYSTAKSSLRGMLPTKKSRDWSGIATYTDQMLRQFITGEADIASDENWSRFLEGYKDIPVEWEGFLNIRDE